MEWYVCTIRVSESERPTTIDDDDDDDDDTGDTVMFVVSVGLKHQSSFEETLCGEVKKARDQSSFPSFKFYLRIRKSTYYKKSRSSFLARLRMNLADENYRGKAAKANRPIQIIEEHRSNRIQ